MKTVAEYGREWDAKWAEAGKLAERLKDPKYLREALEKSYWFHDASHPVISANDSRVSQILDFLQEEIGKSDLNRRNFALQLLEIPNSTKNNKLSFYFNEGYGFQGDSGGIGFDISDAFDQNGKLTPLGREALRHEGPIGHGAQVERDSFIATGNGKWQHNPLFNDIQGGLISNVTEAKAMTAQCIANFEAGEPIGVNAVGFSEALNGVLKKNNLTEKGLWNLRQTNPKQYNTLITEIKKQQFAYMCVNRANIGGYQQQTLTSMNILGKGQANTPLFKKYFECECRSLGLTPKDAAEVWKNFEPYVTGKSAMPGFENFFGPDGNLFVADRNAVKSSEGMRGLRKQLLRNYILSEADKAKFDKFVLRADKELSILKKELTAKYKDVAWPDLDPKVQRYADVLAAREIALSEIKYGYLTVKQLKDNPIIEKEILKLNKKQFSNTAPTVVSTKPVVKPNNAQIENIPDSPKSKVSKGRQTLRRTKQTLKKVNHWAHETIVGQAATFAGQTALMWGENKVGEQFRTYEDVQKEQKMRVLFEERIQTDTSVAKAEAFLGVAGLTVGGAGIGYAVAGRIAKKQGALWGAKSLPFVGAIISAGCAVPRAMRGDWTGVGMELSSAAMDVGSALAALATPVSAGTTAPAAGYFTLSSMAINTAIAVRDGKQKNGIISLAMVDENGEIVLSQQKDKDGKRLPAVGAQITYDHDKKNGKAVWRALDKDGYEYEAQIGNFKNDKKHGEWVTRGEDGTILEIANYDNDRLVGQYIRCDLNGNPVAYGDYTNGHFVEYWTDANGNATDIIKWEGDFKNGKPIGIRRDFDRNGVGLDIIDYDHGQMEYAKLDENGKVIFKADGKPYIETMKFKPREELSENMKRTIRMRSRGLGGPKQDDPKPHTSWDPRRDKHHKKPSSTTQVQAKPLPNPPKVDTPKPLPTGQDYIKQQQSKETDSTKTSSSPVKPSETEPQKPIQKPTEPTKPVDTKPVSTPTSQVKPPHQPTKSTQVQSVIQEQKPVEPKSQPQSSTQVGSSSEKPYDVKPSPGKTVDVHERPRQVVDQQGKVYVVQDGRTNQVGHIDSHGVYHGADLSGRVYGDAQYDPSWNSQAYPHGIAMGGHGEVYDGLSNGEKPQQVGTYQSSHAGAEIATVTASDKPKQTTKTEPSKPTKPKTEPPKQAGSVEPPKTVSQPMPQPPKSTPKPTPQPTPTPTNLANTTASGSTTSAQPVAKPNPPTVKPTPTPTAQPKPQQPPKKNPRMDHETGGKKTGKTPSGVGKADPRKRPKGQYGNGKGLDDKLGQAQQGNSRPTSTKTPPKQPDAQPTPASSKPQPQPQPAKTPSGTSNKPTLIDTAKTVAGATTTGMLVKTGVALGQAAFKKWKSMQKNK